MLQLLLVGAACLSMTHPLDQAIPTEDGHIHLKIPCLPAMARSSRLSQQTLSSYIVAGITTLLFRQCSMMWWLI